MCDADVYFWRQCVVFAADCLHAVSVGFILAFPAVLNPAILAPEPADLAATAEQASWINSLYGFSGVVGFCVMPGAMQRCGRRAALLALNLFVLAGFVMIALAGDVATLYAARAVQGLSICGVYLTSIILAEYSQPSRRGCFISLQKGCVALGSLMCHALVLACSWRQIATVAAIPSISSMLLIFLWHESPAFLAMRGRYEECDRSYIYFYGDSPNARKQLEDLKSSQIKRRRREEKEAARAKRPPSCAKFLKKDYLKPFLITTLLTTVVYSSGRYFNLVYVARVIAEVTATGAAGVPCSVALDALAAAAGCASSCVIGALPRRTMLFTFGYISVALIFLISLVVYLKSTVVWLTPCLILLNSFIINLGVVPVCFTVSGEIFPLEHRGSGSTASGMVFTMVHAVTMKYTAALLGAAGVHGTYGVHGLLLAAALFMLHFILPETKDKTLQQIEDEIKACKADKSTPAREREALA